MCAAQPGELCARIDAYGARYLAQVFHAERIEDAANWNAPAQASVTKEDFDKAVEDSGLV